MGHTIFIENLTDPVVQFVHTIFWVLSGYSN